MADVPYWTLFEAAGVRIVPWSGEVIPVEVPEVPVSVPIAGPVIHFIGEGEHAVWNDVWGWIKGESSNVADGIKGLLQVYGDDIVNAIETYVGKALQATSGFINQGFDYTVAIGQAAVGDLSYVWSSLQGAIDYADGVIFGLLTDVNGIDARIENEILPDIARVAIDAEIAIAGTAANLQTWAIDNIYDPLTAELEKEITSVRTDVWNLVGGWVDQLSGEINAESLARIAAVAGIAAAVAGVATWVEDCGQPMCDTLGPKTDLGKLLKGLKIAGEIAALEAILQMTESDLGGLIHDVTSHLASVVGDLETWLQPGGETVAGLIAHATADLT